MRKSSSSAGTIDRLLEFVEENNGSLSATRLAFLLWVIGVLVVWIVDSLRSGTPQSVTGDVATIIGILMTGKVVQKFGEEPAPGQDVPDSADVNKTKAASIDQTK